VTLAKSTRLLTLSKLLLDLASNQPFLRGIRPISYSQAPDSRGQPKAISIAFVKLVDPVSPEPESELTQMLSLVRSTSCVEEPRCRAVRKAKDALPMSSAALSLWQIATGEIAEDGNTTTGRVRSGRARALA